MRKSTLAECPDDLWKQKCGTEFFKVMLITDNILENFMAISIGIPPFV